MTDVFVLGSINQDFVLKVERRPEPGETVTNAELSTHNGGKGANQAAAAALLGASVAFLGRPSKRRVSTRASWSGCPTSLPARPL